MAASVADDLLNALAQPQVAPLQSTSPAAQTAADSNAQIQALQVLILQLQAVIANLIASRSAQTLQPSPSAVPQTAVSCPNLARALSRGMRGDDVTELQQFLIAESLLAPDSATGFFGPLTESAVQKFQCAQLNICSGSPQDNGYGVVGPKTRSAIAATCTSTSPLAMPSAPLQGGSPGGGGGGGGSPPVGPVQPPPPIAPTSTTALPPHNPTLFAPPAPAPIQIAPLLALESTYVVNSQWAMLPKENAAIPSDANGSPDYSTGSAAILPPGYTYSGGGVTGSNALVIRPPLADGDITKVNFYALPGIGSGTQWTLRAKVALQGDAPAGTKAALRIGVSADQLHQTDELWTYLATTEVSAGQTYDLSIPLDAWPLRDNFVLIFEAQKGGTDNYFQSIVLNDVSLDAARAAPWNSVGRGGIYPETQAKQNQIFDALAQIPADWHRVEAPQTVADAAANAATLKRIQDQGKRILLIVGPSSEDYGWDVSKARYANDPLFQQKCGSSWGAFPLSAADFATYEKNLATKLQALRAAGVNIDAFDIGNELDWVCSNGDLPLDRVANQSEIDTVARSYASLLEHSVRAINTAYPNAMTVSGLSGHLRHGSGVWTTGMIERPGQVVGMLGNIDGKNYLQLIDRIGVHFYRDADNPGIITSDLNDYDADAGRPGKPFWITEWGYVTSSFPTAGGRDRYTAFVDFYDAVSKASVPTDNLFFYALDDFNWGGHTLVDANYNLLPEAARLFGKF